MTAVLAFAAAFLSMAVMLVCWRLARALPARHGVADQLRRGRARLAAGIARLAADVSTLEPGGDPMVRRHLADAAERLAIARHLYEAADTPEEVLAVAGALVDGTRSANRARVLLGLPKRKLPAIRGHRELVRRTGRVERAEWPSQRRERWMTWAAVGIVGLPVSAVWYIAFIVEADQPISFRRWFFAWLPFAAMAVLFGWAVLTQIRKSEVAFDAYAQKCAEAEVLLAKIAGRLAHPAAGAPDVEAVTAAYTEAQERLAAAGTVEEIEALIGDLWRLVIAAQGAERPG